MKKLDQTERIGRGGSARIQALPELLEYIQRQELRKQTRFSKCARQTGSIFGNCTLFVNIFSKTSSILWLWVFKLKIRLHFH